MTANAREAALRFACRRLADRNGFRQIVEIGCGEIAEIGLDQDVRRLEQGERGADVLLGQDVDHLASDTEERVELAALHQRRAQVHRDDDVGAHRAGDVHRQVVGEPAVDEQIAFDFRRRNRTRHRHARAHHARELAVAEHDRRAGDEVRGNGAKRDRQGVELPEAGRLDETAQHRLDLRARHDAFLEQQRAVAQPQLEAEEDRAVIELAADRLVLAGRIFIEQHAGGNFRDQRFHFGRGHAACVRAPDHGAHARAGDAVDRDMQRLEHFQDADMRSAPRTAAGQDDTNLGAVTVRGLRANGFRRPRHGAAERRTPCDDENCERSYALRSACHFFVATGSTAIATPSVYVA